MEDVEEAVHASAREPALVPAQARLKTGRNEPCPCGSGRKYKKCCLRADEERAWQAAAASQSESPAIAKLQPAVPAGEKEDTLDADEAVPSRKAREISDADRRLDELWQWFDSLSSPSAGQLDEWLDRLLALPPEGTEWNEVLEACARKGHPDLPAVFRRIAARVPHTRKTGMRYFYWAAAEEFTRRGFGALLPEVAAGFAKLDEDSYDADALAHVENFLLAGRFETETLALAERFLPVVRADDGLMPYAAVEECTLIFQLRAGIALRGGYGAPVSPQTLTPALRRDLEEDIEDDAIRLVVQVACETADPAWTRARFDLVRGDIRASERAWQDCARVYDALLRVAREAWRIEGVPPGWAFVGLSRLLESVYRARSQDEMKRPRSRKTHKEVRTRNLLDYLNPAGMEQRIARECRGVLGVNVARAQILVAAHAVLLDFASRHGLLADGSAGAARTELTRLRGVLAPA